MADRRSLARSLARSSARLPPARSPVCFTTRSLAHSLACVLPVCFFARVLSCLSTRSPPRPFVRSVDRLGYVWRYNMLRATRPIFLAGAERCHQRYELKDNEVARLGT